MRIRSLLLFFVLPLLISAQVRFDNNWLFGNNLGDTIEGYGGTILNFNNNPTIPAYFPIALDLNASTTISDSSGKLLFYSNGCMIANRQNAVMENGDGINAGSNPAYAQSCALGYGYDTHQGAMTLPYPGQPNKYIMLHLRRPGQKRLIEELLYTIVDMEGDAGLGAVTEKNQLTARDTFVDMLTAVRHANGRDWWIVLPKLNTPTYYVFLLSPQGISAPLIQQNLGLPITIWSWSIQATFSPNGKKYANLSAGPGLQVFDFDRCTGRLSNPVIVPFPGLIAFAAGVAFSSSSRYLYASAVDRLYQFDMTVSPLVDSKTTVGIFDGFIEVLLPVNFYQMMLAPDHKIYMTTSNSSRYLHVIRQPDKKGLGCEFVQREVHLFGYHNFSPPNFPHFRLFDVPGSPCDTLGINGPQPPEDTLVVVPPLPCAGSIRLHPNPATSMTTLELPGCQGGTLTVYDIMGRLVEVRPLAAEVVSVPFDVSRYVPGVYLLQIRMVGGEVVVRSLAVVRQ